MPFLLHLYLTWKYFNLIHYNRYILIFLPNIYTFFIFARGTLFRVFFFFCRMNFPDVQQQLIARRGNNFQDDRFSGETAFSMHAECTRICNGDKTRSFSANGRSGMPFVAVLAQEWFGQLLKNDSNLAKKYTFIPRTLSGPSDPHSSSSLVPWRALSLFFSLSLSLFFFFCFQCIKSAG